MRRRRWRCAAAAALVGLAGCGGEPPRALAGFELGMSRAEVMSLANSRGGYGCRLRGSRPALTVCEGPAGAGRVGVVVLDDSLTSVRLELTAEDSRAGRRQVRRFARPFGEPVWRDRAYPGARRPTEGHHTLWIDRDTTRGVAMVCAGRELGPPCAAELVGLTPAGLQARLDSLLGIRR